MKPPRFHFGLPFRAASIWSQLEIAGVGDVTGVWQHVAQLMTVVAIRQRYAGHAKRAALIAAAQAVEHYEITRYGTLAAWAKLLGRNDVAKLLHTNLKEEKATDKKLSGIAKRKINRKAAARQRKRPDAIERAENSMLVAAAGIPAV